MYPGRCTCGQIRYHLTSRPLFVHGCHCTWCQRESGSAFAQNALIESDRVVLDDGSLDEMPIPSESGGGQTLVGCSICRTTLWSFYSSPDLAFIKVGTLDEPQLFAPDIHIFTGSKQDWVILPADKPAVEKYYSLYEYWPQESQARFQILFPNKKKRR